LDPNSQAQSHLRTPLAYTNVTARSVRAALLAGGWLEAALPSVRTFSNVLNRQGYRLRRVEKSPVQKTAATDAIFANVNRENQAADADPQSVRISMDTKAVINLGPYSRGGLSRGLQPVAAADHDLLAKAKLVPGGILEMSTGRPFLFFTESAKTSDFMVDGLELWWTENQRRLAGVKRLVVNLDNGPSAAAAAAGSCGG
jgi:hypothetical protein